MAADHRQDEAWRPSGSRGTGARRQFSAVLDGVAQRLATRSAVGAPGGLARAADASNSLREAAAGVERTRSSCPASCLPQCREPDARAHGRTASRVGGPSGCQRPESGPIRKGLASRMGPRRSTVGAFSRKVDGLLDPTEAFKPRSRTALWDEHSGSGLSHHGRSAGCAPSARTPVWVSSRRLTTLGAAL